MVLYLAADLIWATRIKAAAEDVGGPARPVRTVEMLEARLQDAEPRGLLVDLESEVALEVIDRARRARDEGGLPARIVAFGPHADVDRLEAASEAGADAVLARGAVASRRAPILRERAGD